MAKEPKGRQKKDIAEAMRLAGMNPVPRRYAAGPASERRGGKGRASAWVAASRGVPARGLAFCGRSRGKTL